MSRYSVTVVARETDSEIFEKQFGLDDSEGVDLPDGIVDYFDPETRCMGFHGWPITDRPYYGWSDGQLFACDGHDYVCIDADADGNPILTVNTVSSEIRGLDGVWRYLRILHTAMTLLNVPQTEPMAMPANPLDCAQPFSSSDIARAEALAILSSALTVAKSGSVDWKSAVSAAVSRLRSKEMELEPTEA